MTSWAAVKFQVSGFQRGTAEPKMGSTPPKAIAAMAKNGTTKRATSQIVPGRVKEAQRPWGSALLPSPRATSASRDGAVCVRPELLDVPRQRVQPEAAQHVGIGDERAEEGLGHQVGRDEVVGRG